MRDGEMSVWHHWPLSSPEHRPAASARQGRTTGLVFGVMTVLWAAPMLSAVAATSTHRPHHAQPSPAQRDDITATIPAPKAQPPRDRKQPPQNDETLPEPFHLPTATRERMHECGMKWQGLKTAGETGDETWREFATVCLASTDGTDKAPR